MATVRILPPSGGATITVNGRTYTAAANSYVDVPDFDAQVMAANGWHIASIGGAGATSARPANPAQGTRFLDTTLGYMITYHGGQWRSMTSGAVV